MEEKFNKIYQQLGPKIKEWWEETQPEHRENLLLRLRRFLFKAKAKCIEEHGEEGYYNFFQQIVDAMPEAYFVRELYNHENMLMFAVSTGDNRIALMVMKRLEEKPGNLAKAANNVSGSISLHPRGGSKHALAGAIKQGMDYEKIVLPLLAVSDCYSSIGPVHRNVQWSGPLAEADRNITYGDEDVTAKYVSQEVREEIRKLVRQRFDDRKLYHTSKFKYAVHWGGKQLSSLFGFGSVRKDSGQQPLPSSVISNTGGVVAGNTGVSSRRPADKLVATK